MARECGFDRHSSQVPDINRGLIPARPYYSIISNFQRKKMNQKTKAQTQRRRLI